MSHLIGFDLSTTSVGVARLTLEGEYVESWTCKFEDPSVRARTHDWGRFSAPKDRFYDDVAQVVIEQPMGQSPAVNTWIGAMIGGTLAHIPATMNVLIVKPQEWRSWLGWPRLKRADAKDMAIKWAEAKTGLVLPEDEAEAVCMCLAALQELNRHATAA